MTVKHADSFGCKIISITSRPFSLPFTNRVTLKKQLAMTVLIERFGVGVHGFPEHLTIDEGNTH